MGMATMPTVLVDHDVEGQIRALTYVWTSPDWIELWLEVLLDLNNFRGTRRIFIP